MLGGEYHIGEHIGLGVVHQCCQLGYPAVGDLAPLSAGYVGIILRERGADPGGNDAALRLAGIGHGIAHELNTAPLPGSAEYLALLSNSGPGVLANFGPPPVPQPTVTLMDQGAFCGLESQSGFVRAAPS